MGASSVAPDYGLESQRVMALSAEYGTNAATLNRRVDCDSCPYCTDTCDHVESCMSCQKKRNAMHVKCRGPETSWFIGALSSICPTSDSQDIRQSRTYSMCQLRRHNHGDSAWILCGNTIYDATTYIRSHPGGMEAILRKSGGAVDCTEDLRFHSKRAQKEWKKYKVGTLCHCPHAHQ
mmetsp:Transcript_20963/g.45453  ORF Transcript_20963/g.45453 Transcript_20963/m.45453 type:complete len:178 (-) Transcript_20963:72-605(-)